MVIISFASSYSSLVVFFSFVFGEEEEEAMRKEE